MPHRLGVGQRAYLFPWPNRGQAHPPTPKTLVKVTVTPEDAARLKYIAMTIMTPELDGTFLIYGQPGDPLCLAQHWNNQMQLTLIHL